MGFVGGMPGETGRVVVRRRDGEKICMSSKSAVDLFEGDIVIVMTPGGGGYGSP